jgi:hypothetical protein
MVVALDEGRVVSVQPGLGRLRAGGGELTTD